MSLGGADRIAIDAAGTDLGSPAPLDGVVDPDHDRRADGTKALISRINSRPATARDDHAARLRIRWKVQKPGRDLVPGCATPP